MSEYKMKPGKIGEKVIGAYKNVEEKVCRHFPGRGRQHENWAAWPRKSPVPTKRWRTPLSAATRRWKTLLLDAFLEKSEDGSSADTEHTEE